MYRVALRTPRSMTIFQNEDDRRLFVGKRLVEPERTVLIRGSGVDLAQFPVRPEPEPPLVVMCPARLLGDKGVREFAAAAAKLRGDGVQARFILVGRLDPGNPAAIGADELAAWTAGGAVEWWGNSDEMPSTLSRAHLIVLPSYREGLPKVLLEAGAVGRAVVTTNVPGCRDVVEDGVNGLLVPARDSDALAEAIRRLLEDPERRRAMARRARSIVEERFCDREVARQTLRVYERLLRSCPSSVTPERMVVPGAGSR
jgi:glycosyltransferase involved in cell wall biosynthesis